MVKLTREQVKELVDAIEYMLAHEGTVSVATLMKELAIEDFDDYRNLSALCMPAIRKKNEMMAYKVSAAQYKGLYNKERQDRVVTDEMLKVAYDYLDRRFKSKRPIVKTKEEDAEDGEDNDPVGNDCESDQ